MIFRLNSKFLFSHLFNSQHLIPHIPDAINGLLKDVTMVHGFYMLLMLTCLIRRFVSIRWVPYVIHFAAKKARTKWKLLCLFTPLYPRHPLTLCTHTNFQGRKILCLIFFSYARHHVAGRFSLFSWLAQVGTHTIFIISYSLPSCKLKNYYDSGARASENEI